MANFVVLVDADRSRRERFLKEIENHIAPVPGLATGGVAAGDLAAVWAAAPNAPISSIEGAGTAAVVWGDAIRGPGRQRMVAADLAVLWHDVDRPATFDGFHAAFSYSESGRLTAGVDVLGLFPLYYASAKGVLIVGSSPELFRRHPLFPALVDQEGMVALLLNGGPVGARTLLRDVRRLAPGHALSWSRSGGVRELEQYSPPESEVVPARPFQEQIEQLDATWATVMARHGGSEATEGVLLSGGRDSRLIAGYLQRGDRPVRALTLGRESDHEMRCARAVAQEAGFEHHTFPLAESRLDTAALLQARWEHLGTGFSSIHMWNAIEPLRSLPAHFFTGYVREIRERSPDHGSADAFLEEEQRHAVPAGILNGMLAPALRGAPLDDLHARLRSTYHAAAARPEDRAWRFILANRARFHPGGVPWRLSFASWPVLPILDREALAMLAALPASTLAERRAQDELLRSRFPHLARLPLDRNSWNTTPLLPTHAGRLRRAVARAAAPFTTRLQRAASRVERRYYHRVYDFNGPGWQKVRRLAEPHREHLSPWFRMDRLHAYVPPPDTRVDMPSTITDAFGRKMLIGLMLWFANQAS
jgi:asparagine synthase (glutamine-hydrolysing)